MRQALIYDIMRKIRHQYQYTVHRQKRCKLEIQKQKLADNTSNTKDFWRELKKIKPVSKVIAHSIDSATRDNEITEKIC